MNYEQRAKRCSFHEIAAQLRDHGVDVDPTLLQNIVERHVGVIVGSIDEEDLYHWEKHLRIS